MGKILDFPLNSFSSLYVLHIEDGQVNLPARNFRQDDDDEGDEMT